MVALIAIILALDDTFSGYIMPLPTGIKELSYKVAVARSFFYNSLKGR